MERRRLRAASRACSGTIPPQASCAMPTRAMKRRLLVRVTMGSICQACHSKPRHCVAPWCHARRQSLSKVIAELSGIGEIRHFPTVQVVLRHAIFGKALEPVGIAGSLRTEQAIAADLFGRT